jgi:hypothetical protein
MDSTFVVDRYAVSHFSNHALLADLRTRVANERGATAIVLSRIVEVEDRRLYLEEGYSCMKDFCVRELHYSEGAAYKRITAARKARELPQILNMLADGRLHLSGVVILSKYLRSGNADDLLSAATYKTKAEIELLIANRFGRPDWPDRLQVSVPAPTPAPEWLAALSPGQ